MKKKVIFIAFAIFLMTFISQKIAIGYFNLPNFSFAESLKQLYQIIPFLMFLGFFILVLDFFRMSLIAKSCDVALDREEIVVSVCIGLLFSAISIGSVLGPLSVSFYLFTRKKGPMKSFLVSYFRSFSIMASVAVPGVVLLYLGEAYRNVFNDNYFYRVNLLTILLLIYLVITVLFVAGVTRFKPKSIMLNQASFHVKNIFLSHLFKFFAVLILSILINFISMIIIPVTYFFQNHELITTSHVLKALYASEIFHIFSQLMPSPSGVGFVELAAPAILQDAFPNGHFTQLVLFQRVFTTYFQIIVGILALIYGVNNFVDFKKLMQFKNKLMSQDQELGES